MRDLFLARQPIVNLSHEIVGYELLFRDSDKGIIDMPSNLSATAKLIYNLINHMDIDCILGKDQIASINCDHTVILSGYLDVLDPKRFYLELLETTEVTPELVKRVSQLHAKGFKFSLDDFDCRVDTYYKFEPLLDYIKVIKICLHTIDLAYCHECMELFKGRELILLAEKIESKTEYDICVELGFNLFQGYYIHKPETLSCISYSDVTKLMMVELLSCIQTDPDYRLIEDILKGYPELVLKLFRFTSNRFKGRDVRSIRQALTLLGKKDLTRWCLINMHADMCGDELNQMSLDVILKRAESLSKYASKEEAPKAYLVGLISALSDVYEIETGLMLKGLTLDRELLDAVLYQTGYLGDLLKSVLHLEREDLWNVIYQNKNKLTVELMVSLVKSIGEMK